MKLNRAVIAAIVLCVLMLAAGVAAYSQATYTGQQWEYLWTKFSDYDDDFLRPQVDNFFANGSPVEFQGSVFSFMNGLGQEGWEYTGIVDGFMVFKRPKQ